MFHDTMEHIETTWNGLGTELRNWGNITQFALTLGEPHRLGWEKKRAGRTKTRQAGC